jgi:hypothetical protein
MKIKARCRLTNSPWPLPPNPWPLTTDNSFPRKEINIWH